MVLAWPPVAWFVYRRPTSRQPLHGNCERGRTQQKWLLGLLHFFVLEWKLLYVSDTMETPCGKHYNFIKTSEHTNTQAKSSQRLTLFESWGRSWNFRVELMRVLPILTQCVLATCYKYNRGRLPHGSVFGTPQLT